MRAAVLMALLAAAPAWAEDAPMTIDAFDRFVTGKVMLHFSGNDESYGAEEYLPGRRVRWAFTADTCLEGQYFEQAGFICFDYLADPELPPQCWHYWENGPGLTAVPAGESPDGPRYELRPSPDPLPCSGPDVGV